MKIIHCSDLHLDSKMDSVLPQELAKLRKAQLLLSVKKLMEAAKSLGASAVIIAGDIFDNERVTKQTQTYLWDTFEQFPEINIYIAPGNHSGDLIFENAELPKNVFLFAKDWTSFDVDDVTFTGIAFCDTSKAELYNKLKLDGRRYNVVIMHGQTAQYGGDKLPVINLNHLKDKHIDYLALGHIHTFKAEKLDERGTCCYSGCLSGRGFDECGSKGYAVVDTDKKAVDFVRLDQCEFREVDVDITGLITIKELENKIASLTVDIPHDDYVKIVLVGAYTAETQKDITTLTKLIADQFVFVKIVDKSKMAINIDDYKNTVSLKGEFIKHVLSDAALGDEQKSDIIYCGIKALYGEDLD